MKHGDIVLLAAVAIENGTAYRTFTAETLIVFAWQEDKAVFGLRKYEQLYPDSNRVMCCVLGAKGLVAKGYLRRRPDKQYVLTDLGRNQTAIIKRQRELAAEDVVA